MVTRTTNSANSYPGYLRSPSKPSLENDANDADQQIAVSLRSR